MKVGDFARAFLLDLNEKMDSMHKKIKTCEKPQAEIIVETSFLNSSDFNELSKSRRLSSNNYSSFAHTDEEEEEEERAVITLHQDKDEEERQVMAVTERLSRNKSWDG